LEFFVIVQSSPRKRRRAFTLIELVVVLLIVATLAGLAIPLVGMLGRSADMAASADSQSELNKNIQLYFVLQKRYPQGFDSLLDTTGAIYASDTTDSNTQTKGLPYSGADGTRMQAQLTAGTLTNATGAEYLRSFTRSGFDWVYDHDLTVVNSNNSGTTFRGLIANANNTGNTAPTTVNVAEVTGTALIAKMVPQGLVTGERLVALGIGPRIAATNKTLANAPIYPGCDGKYYGRYIAIFKVYASGERATLVGVVDSYGRHPDYTQQQFNESLPDGGRQG
jgi:prepilin-type N-terminal cleavage/methylation domain-containing protein